MKKIITFIVLIGLVVLPGCTGAKPNAGIDIKKMENDFKKNDDRSKYNEAAKKSIFPKMKE